MVKMLRKCCKGITMLGNFEEGFGLSGREDIFGSQIKKL